MRKKYTSVSVVIPIFNEKRTIKQLLARVVAADTLGLAKEIVVVDDGSTDGTAEWLRHLHQPGLKKIFLTTNRGKGYALRSGFSQASGEIILVQDADLEYDPADYPTLLAPFLNSRARVVYGSRELTLNTHSYPLFFLGGKAVTYMTRLLYGGHLTDVPTGYKVFARSLLAEIPLRCERFEFCPELTARLLQHRIPIVEVPIRYKPRKIEAGKKIRLQDGIAALWTLLSLRISP